MKHPLSSSLAAIAVAALTLLPALTVRADEIKVLTTGILKGAFPAIAAQFERETGHVLVMSWGPSSGNSPEASQVRIRNGEHVDVLMMVTDGMDRLVKDGHFVALHRRDVAVSRIGIAVKAGRPQPDVATVPALRQALLAAGSIGYSEGASGTYIAQVLLPKLGIADQVAGKSHVILGRKFVAEEVASGAIELGIQQISELRLEPGVVVVGALPDDLQKASVVSGAVSAKARNEAAAKRFLDFLATPFAVAEIRRSGLDPAPESRL